MNDSYENSVMHHVTNFSWRFLPRSYHGIPSGTPTGYFPKKKLFEISLCVPYEFCRWLSLENPSEAFFRDSYLRLVRDFSENSICRSIQEFYLGISSGTLGGSPD